MGLLQSYSTLPPLPGFYCMGAIISGCTRLGHAMGRVEGGLSRVVGREAFARVGWEQDL